MFDNIIEARVDSEISKVKDLDFISFNSVRNSGLSIFTKNFINAETDKLGDRDKLYDFIEKSVKLNLNYTLRPKWTLINYLFGNFDSKSYEKILNKLEIFQFYLYYPELITNYIRESSMVVVTKDKIRNLIGAADRTLYDKFTQNLSSIKIRNFFLQLFKLIYEDESRIGLDSAIPFSYLRIFLEDKSFNELLYKFSKIEGLKDDWNLDLKTIIKVLTDKYFLKEDAGETINIQKTEDNKEIDVKPETENTATETAAKAEAETVTVTEEKSEEPPPEPVKREFPVKTIRESALQSSKRILNLFKQSEQRAILKKVFLYNEFEMRTAFKDLENIDNWYYASEYLKKIFIKNNVKIHSSSVVLFIDILNDYFNRKEFDSQRGNS